MTGEQFTIEVGEAQGRLPEKRTEEGLEFVFRDYPFKSSLYDPSFMNGRQIQNCVQSKLKFTNWSRIHCLSIEDGTLHSNTLENDSHVCLEQAFTVPVEGKQQSLAVYLIPLAGNTQLDITRTRFIDVLEYAQIPPHFAAVLADNNGVTATSQGHPDESGNPENVELLIKFPLAPAINGSVYFRHEFLHSQTKIALIFNETLLDRLREVLQHNGLPKPVSKAPKDPFITLTTMVSESVAILENRRRALDEEVQVREASTGVTLVTWRMYELSIDQYPLLFDLLHLSQQDLMYMERTIEFQAGLVGFFQEQHRILTSTRLQFASTDEERSHVRGEAQKVINSLSLSVSQIHHMLMQVRTLSLRIRFQLDIVESRLSQSNARTQVQMSKTQVVIAEETKRDSMAMKTIAAVTMLFLPGTFTASVFAMPFFGTSNGNGQGPGFEVNKWIWVYIAITVPLTVIVVLAWVIWQKWLNKKSFPHSRKEKKFEKE